MLLSVENLSTEFPVKKGIVKAVEDVSFDVDAGEILAIVGESGSGKSVTSLSVMGLLAEPGHVAGGSMEFEGQDLVHLSERELPRAARQRHGSMIFQEPMTSLNPVYTASAQADRGGHAANPPEHAPSTRRRERAIEMLRKVGIPEPRDSASTTTRTSSRAACASAS